MKKIKIAQWQKGLPEGYDISIKPQPWSCSDVGGLDLNIAVAERSRSTSNIKKGDELYLEYKAKAIVDPSIISPSHYKALLDIDKRLSHKRARTILLTKDK